MQAAGECKESIYSQAWRWERRREEREERRGEEVMALQLSEGSSSCALWENLTRPVTVSLLPQHKNTLQIQISSFFIYFLAQCLNLSFLRSLMKISNQLQFVCVWVCVKCFIWINERPKRDAQIEIWRINARCSAPSRASFISIKADRMKQ